MSVSSFSSPLIEVLSHTETEVRQGNSFAFSATNSKPRRRSTIRRRSTSSRRTRKRTCRPTAALWNKCRLPTDHIHDADRHESQVRSRQRPTHRPSAATGTLSSTRKLVPSNRGDRQMPLAHMVTLLSATTLSPRLATPRVRYANRWFFSFPSSWLSIRFDSFQDRTLTRRPTSAARFGYFYQRTFHALQRAHLAVDVFDLGLRSLFHISTCRGGIDLQR